MPHLQTAKHRCFSRVLPPSLLSLHKNIADFTQGRNGFPQQLWENHRIEESGGLADNRKRDYPCRQSLFDKISYRKAFRPKRKQQVSVPVRNHLITRNRVQPIFEMR